MTASQQPNFLYNLFQMRDYVGNLSSFLARKTVHMSDENGLLIFGEAKVFLTYPFSNFGMDALCGTEIHVLVRINAGNINSAVKQ